MCFFCTKKMNDNEADNSVERAEESHRGRAGGLRHKQCETQTEDTCASTSTQAFDHQACDIEIFFFANLTCLCYFLILMFI